MAGGAMDKTYRLDQKQFEQQKKSIILLYGGTSIVTIIVLLLTQRFTNSSASPWMIIGLILILLVFVGFRSLRQRRELWDQYLLTVSGNRFIQSQPNYPDIQVDLQDVTSVEETKEGLFLSSKQGKRVFGIPRQLKEEDYQEVKAMFAGWFESEQDVNASEE